MRPLRVDPGAAADLENAISWYESESPGLGDEFDVALSGLVQSVLTGLVQGRVVPTRRFHGAVRKVEMTRFPFSVVYLDMADVLVLVAVAHQRRRPGFWKERLSRT